MKEIVENRNRIPMMKKFALAGEVVRQNGVTWTFLLGTYYATSAMAERAFAAMDSLRAKRGLPGLNSAGLNKLIWESWDWNAGGEEWTPSPDWKDSVIRSILKKHMPDDGVIVEIGPGGGRWTESLLEVGSRVHAVDISEECLRVCRDRFAGRENIEFHSTPGDSLPGFADGIADAVWSFDVFVHINRPETEGYAREFARVLKAGGVGVLHHGTQGGSTGGWRSNMTAETMIEVLEGSGFEIVDQFTEWTDGGREHQAGLYGDAVTVFRKPG